MAAGSPPHSEKRQTIEPLRSAQPVGLRSGVHRGVSVWGADDCWELDVEVSPSLKLVLQPGTRLPEVCEGTAMALGRDALARTQPSACFSVTHSF